MIFLFAIADISDGEVRLARDLRGSVCAYTEPQFRRRREVKWPAESQAVRPEGVNSAWINSRARMYASHLMSGLDMGGNAAAAALA